MYAPSTFFLRSAFPGGAVVHKANKVVCVVRNPYDAIISLMGLLATGDHSAKLNEDFQKDIPGFTFLMGP